MRNVGYFANSFDRAVAAAMARVISSRMSSLPISTSSAAAVVRKDVRFLNLRSGAQRILAGPMIGRPMTNGWAVSWLQGQCFLSCYQGTLTLLHLRSGAQRVLENLHAKEQTMSGTVLLWFSEDARGNGEMKALDLLNGKLYLLGTEFESAPPGAPILRSPGWGWGKEVIWT